MFELFGKKKKYNEGEGIPGAEKMAKIEVAHADEEGVLMSGQDAYKGDNADSIQDNFKDNKVSERSLGSSRRMSEDFGGGILSDQAYSRDEQKIRTKYANDQKPIRKDKNKDWKEKEPFALDLPEEEEKKSPLDLMAEEDQDNDEDDFEEEHREAA